MGCFEFDGEKYKQASKHQKEWGNKLMLGLRLSGGEAILDIGCGDGVLTQQLAALAPAGRVVGIDASLGMIKTAEKLKSENLSFAHMNVDAMDYEDQFDIIFSNAALHWVKNHKRLLAASFRALKPNGVIAWNFAGQGTCENFIATVKTLMGSKPYQGCFANFAWPWYMPPKDEYEPLVAKAGFEDIQINYENADRYFADVDEMVRWVDQPSIVPFLACVPDEMKSDFRRELVDEMVRRTLRLDGRCFETFKRLNVQAAKPRA